MLDCQLLERAILAALELLDLAQQLERAILAALELLDLAQQLERAFLPPELLNLT
jgi:hypothetical protein